MKFRRAVSAVACAAALALGPAAIVSAQQMLLPPSESYNIGGFNYEAPTSAFWRQLSASPSTLELVFVEQLADGNINSRTHVVIEASDVPAAAAVSGAGMLAELSRSQQIEAREGTVKESSEVTSVPGELGIKTYRINSKAGDVDLTELFYVLLAKDKSEYIVAKLATREEDFGSTPYFTEFYASLAGFSHKGDSAGAETPAP